MGIYLTNMEMPKEGSWTTVRIYPDGTCAVPNWQGDCTLIKGTKAAPVPPHGRLIEAEPIMKFITDGLNSGEFGYDQIKVLTEIQYAPTIIPAEEGER